MSFKCFKCPESVKVIIETKTIFANLCCIRTILILTPNLEVRLLILRAAK